MYLWGHMNTQSLTNGFQDSGLRNQVIKRPWLAGDKILTDRMVGRQEKDGEAAWHQISALSFTDCVNSEMNLISQNLPLFLYTRGVDDAQLWACDS